MTAARNWYVPLDELLAQPRTKLLRAIRFFDWVTSDDLFLACGVADHETDAYSQALARAVKAGNIERRGKRPYEYRLRRTA